MRGGSSDRSGAGQKELGSTSDRPFTSANKEAMSAKGYSLRSLDWLLVATKEHCDGSSVFRTPRIRPDKTAGLGQETIWFADLPGFTTILQVVAGKRELEPPRAVAAFHLRFSKTRGEGNRRALTSKKGKNNSPEWLQG
jgi:hypothetical protein